MEDKERFEILEKKIDNLTEQVAKGFEAVASDLKAIETKIEKLKGGSSSTLGTVDSKLAEVITEIKKIGVVTRYEEQHQDLNKFGTTGEA